MCDFYKLECLSLQSTLNLVYRPEPIGSPSEPANIRFGSKYLAKSYNVNDKDIFNDIETWSKE